MAHIPVLLGEVVEGLKIREGDVVVDATLGGGGHSELFCSLIGGDGVLIMIDRDGAAIARAKEKIAGPCRKQFVNDNFRNFAEIMKNLEINSVDKILFDLGFSSFQVDDSGRGFTFQKDEPLLMTFSDRRGEEDLTAEEIVNKWDEENISDVIRGYGGEIYASNIAKNIVSFRQREPIKTSFQLVEIISSAVPSWYKRRKIHFATKTFQALRIAVNDELNSFRDGLKEGFSLLSTGGRVAVISFHELEDRITKLFFREKKQNGELALVNKKPITPSAEELKNNPRSRSAKLRIAEKIV